MMGTGAYHTSETCRDLPVFVDVGCLQNRQKGFCAFRVTLMCRAGGSACELEWVCENRNAYKNKSALV